ncbi:DUF2339 domain-containing protein [Tumebacillus flagellatus]|uniref:DUF2339 domain-containing protein n=1 Tax=Tumebacillus flagellatus TaxID=1157490 RepID=A0A074LJR2_9BACL|nr:DUF2339 domain-containing protein [Tumebacillus flagellatus]KEO80845.1 hypothetical protein EL26_24100 [Tumebacillus flagellatus]
MIQFFKRNWITLLGALFLILAFSYLFKYAVDQGWISDGPKIAAGLLVGVAVVLFGVRKLLGRNVILGQVVTGLGVALLYTTCSFAGVYFDLWSSMTVFLSMLIITVGVTALAYRSNLRILMHISLLGGLVSPLVLQPENDQVFSLFLYLLVINAAFFFLSIKKNWFELRAEAFVGTWLLYLVYYVHFDPTTWTLPFLYAASAFVFYIIGFLYSSWQQNRHFEGLNLYLGFANGVLFTLWALLLTDGVVSYTVPLAGMGVIYLLAALIVYMGNRTATLALYSKLIAGILLLLVSASEFGRGWEFKPLLSVYFWALVSAAVMITGQRRSRDLYKWIASCVWVCISLYWFFTTWDAPLGLWFNTFIPFLNTSGVAWILLAVLGFYYSVKVQFQAGKADAESISTFFAVSSHIMVGGLLTFQIRNLWRYYDLNHSNLYLSLSISWGVYALLLFLWGAYSKQAAFRWFGSIVLGLVALKTIFIDLSGSDTIYKVLVLFLLGAITLAIAYINNKWKSHPKDQDSQQSL